MWIEAIVMPREEPPSSRARRPAARRDTRAPGSEAQQQFRATVLDFLNTHQLMGAVKWVSEPGLLPTVTLHCTPTVLEQLRRAPQFEAGRTMSLELYS